MQRLPVCHRHSLFSLRPHLPWQPLLLAYFTSQRNSVCLTPEHAHIPEGWCFCSLKAKLLRVFHQQVAHGVQLVPVEQLSAQILAEYVLRK